MDYPSTQLSDGSLKLTVYLPDAERGFYRSTRFDWSGMIARAECGGHAYFGPWRTAHDPTVYEHGIGPCEEFDLNGPPPLFEQAGPGGAFVKIGVGLLEKPDEQPYDFRRPYRILQPGAWNVVTGSPEPGARSQATRLARSASDGSPAAGTRNHEPAIRSPCSLRALSRSEQAAAGRERDGNRETLNVEPPTRPVACPDRNRGVPNAEAGQVSFHQQLSCGDLAYAYTKTIALAGPGSFRISHVLRNTGRLPIETEHYSHNFIRIDDVPVGPSYRVLLGFDCPDIDLDGIVLDRYAGPRTEQALKAVARVRGRELRLEKPLPPQVALWTRLSGFDGANAAHSAFTVACSQAGAAVAVSLDTPPCRFNFYAEDTAICPEPFVRISLEPGQQRSWTATYTLGPK